MRFYKKVGELLFLLMLKGNWHFIGLSVLFSVIAMRTNELFLVLLMLLGWLLYLYVRKKITLLVVLFSVLSFTFFYLYLPSYERNESINASTPQHIIPQKRTKLTGTIISSTKQTKQLVSFTLQDKVSDEKILVTYFRPHHSTSPDEVEQLFPYTYRAVCTISGKLELPKEATNPFEFNYRKYLFEQNITHQLIVENIDDINCSERRSFLTTVYKVRDRLISQANERLHPEVASWQQALIFGNKDELDGSVDLLFQRWGLSHLLAISGLHVGIIIALVYGLLIRLCGVTREKARLIVLLFLPVYALLAGGQPSVWRATLMTLFVILLGTKQLRISRLDILSLVFLLLILINKYIIFHIGFQFSFAVTLGLILSANWFSSAQSRIELLFQISFIAQMMIVPLQMYYFYHFQPLSILLNIIIVPYFSLVVIPGMFFSFLLYLLPQTIGDMLQAIFLSIHDIVLSTVYFLDRSVNMPFISGEVTLKLAIVYYILLFGMMIQLGNNKRRNAFYFGFGICLLLTFVIVKPYMSKTGSVTMLDIGQGDAFVIELPYRKGVYMIDAGATFDFDSLEPKETVYKNVIRPYLMGRGIREIDAIFISHAHLDHHGSLRFIIEDFKVHEIFVDAYLSADDAELENWLNNENVRIVRVSFTEKIVRNGHSFHVVSPERDHRDKNNNSLVLYGQFGNNKWLFTGDITESIEKQIIRTFPNLKVDILKVAHHGSKTSTSDEWLDALSPKIALVPVGRKNRYGHPSKEVIELLEEFGVDVYRTDEHGAIQYKFRDQHYVITRFLE